MSNPVAAETLANQTLAAGTPIEATVANVPAGSQCVRVFLDVNGDNTLNVGDVISAAGDQAVTVSSGQTTAVTFGLDTIVP